MESSPSNRVTSLFLTAHHVVPSFMTPVSRKDLTCTNLPQTCIRSQVHQDLHHERTEASLWGVGWTGALCDGDGVGEVQLVFRGHSRAGWAPLLPTNASVQGTRGPHVSPHGPFSTEPGWAHPVLPSSTQRALGDRNVSGSGFFPARLVTVGLFVLVFMKLEEPLPLLGWECQGHSQLHSEGGSSPQESLGCEGLRPS